MERYKFKLKKHYKEKYHEASRKSREAKNGNHVYTFEMLQAIRDMAEHDVWPDGTFSDEECNIWSMWHTLYEQKEELLLELDAVEYEFDVWRHKNEES